MDDPSGNTEILNLFSGHGLIYILLVALLVVLLLTAAFISASEVAFFSLRTPDLDTFRNSAASRDRKIVDVLSRPRQLLATMLIMSTTVNVAIVADATWLMWEITGTRSPAAFIVGLVIFTITCLLVFFGTFVPKAYATVNHIAIARATVQTWSVLMFLCKPLAIPMVKITTVIDKRFKKKGYDTVVSELNQALEIASVDSETTEDEKEILKGIVNFGTLTVRQVMRSRMDISAANIEFDFTTLMDWVNKSGFSRIPVYRETVDKIEGVLYIKDLLPFMDQPSTFEWQKLLRPGFFVPETKKIDSLLKDFQEKRVHMALVVDEYGGTSGLVTMEDLIEEIIGEINDEFDEVGINLQRIDEHTFVVEGKTSIHDFCKALDIDSTTFDEVRGDNESLGGLILEINNELPKAGEEINYDRFTFTVEMVDRKSIKRLRVHINEQKESE